MDRMESKLDSLFAEYRAASPDPEPSADFMPGMWKRIEARRQTSMMLIISLQCFACCPSTTSGTGIPDGAVVHQSR